MINLQGFFFSPITVLPLPFSFVRCDTFSCPTTEGRMDEHNDDYFKKKNILVD
jgi:hypothetical protein